MQKNAKLVDAVQSKMGGTKEAAARAVEAVLTSVKEITETDGKLVIKKYGSFIKKRREAREGRNPATGASITIPAKEYISFKEA